MKNNKGFTLAEMLIVVAIIGVLIGIIAMSFTNILERSREATDLANIRQACSELTSAFLFQDQIDTSKFYIDTKKNRIRACVKCQSTQSYWQTSGLEVSGTGIILCDNICYAPDTKKPYMNIYIDLTTGKISFERQESAKKPLYN